jgi:hypothetical protein
MERKKELKVCPLLSLSILFPSVIICLPKGFKLSKGNIYNSFGLLFLLLNFFKNLNVEKQAKITCNSLIMHQQVIKMEPCERV